MAEIGFYHLTRSSDVEALPRLLGRSLDLGKRALVLVRDAARVAAIDEALWQAPSPVWLPHGSAALGRPELQPVWITDDQAAPAPNRAQFLFLLDGTEVVSLDAYERAFDLFDGGNDAAIAAARRRWSRCKQVGCAMTYWQQDTQGWRKALEHFPRRLARE